MLLKFWSRLCSMTKPSMSNLCIDSKIQLLPLSWTSRSYIWRNLTYLKLSPTLLNVLVFPLLSFPSPISQAHASLVILILVNIITSHTLALNRKRYFITFTCVISCMHSVTWFWFLWCPPSFHCLAIILVHSTLPPGSQKCTLNCSYYQHTTFSADYWSTFWTMPFNLFPQ